MEGREGAGGGARAADDCHRLPVGGVPTFSSAAEAGMRNRDLKKRFLEKLAAPLTGNHVHRNLMNRLGYLDAVVPP